MSYFVDSTPNATKTGLKYLDGILWGEHWNVNKDGHKLTYSFINDQSWDNAISFAEQTAFKSAIQSWANVANIRLEYSGFNDHSAELTFHSVPGYVIDGSLGMALVPGDEDIGNFVQGDIMINRDAYQFNPSNDLKIGGNDYMTYVHEIGHALGLAHPHDHGGTSTVYPGVYNALSTGTYGLNQYVWTAMSYVSESSQYSPGYDTNWGYVGGPMAFDIAAIQSIYGINTTYHTGNDVYKLPTFNGPGTYWSSIWDAGGIDTISGKGSFKPVVINLNNASLANNDSNAGGYISQVNGVKGGFTIANSQGGINIIENAEGGSGNDIITGNQVANTLKGGWGNDRLFGLNGDDVLYGESGWDTLDGGNGRDILIGGDGRDTLTGGKGNDLFLFYSRYEGVDKITDFKAGSDVIGLMSSGFKGGLAADHFLSNNQFHIGSSATSADQRVIYNANTGALYFDQDGIGFMGQVQIATLDSGLAMTGHDVYVYG